MAIFIERHNNGIISDYFDFNGYLYQDSNLWDNNLDGSGRYTIPDSLISTSNTLLIISCAVADDLLSWPVSKKLLIEFVTNKNKIWVWNNVDGLLRLNQLKKEAELLDKEIPMGSICFFLDGTPVSGHWIRSLQNIDIKIFPINSFLVYPRIQGSVIHKTNPTKEFLFTTYKKRSRPHRNILWKELSKRPGLKDKGHIAFHRQGDPLIGRPPTQHNTHEYHPSMDLYLDSCLEIVPETLYKDGYFITEKTVKPIATKTPLLMVSTCRYLEYLQSIGFKTFHGIIDESYDKQHRIQDRVKLMVDQLEFISANGAKEFYQACQPILEHNYQRLLELSGSQCPVNDHFIYNCLEELGDEYLS